MRLTAIDYIVGSSELRSAKVALRVTTDGNMYNFFAKDDNEQWTSLGSLNCSLLSTEVAGGFTGITVGLFCNVGSGLGNVCFGKFLINNNTEN